MIDPNRSDNSKPNEKKSVKKLTNEYLKNPSFRQITWYKDALGLIAKQLKSIQNKYKKPIKRLERAGNYQ